MYEYILMKTKGTKQKNILNGDRVIRNGSMAKIRQCNTQGRNKLSEIIKDIQILFCLRLSSTLTCVSFALGCQIERLSGSW